MTTRARTSSPPTKRPKLDPEDAAPGRSPVESDEEDIETDEDHCSICLQTIADCTIIPSCSHEFCFECLLVWTGQSRRCPLCSRDVGEYLIHNIRSKYDFQKHYLLPLRTSPKPVPPLLQRVRTRRARREVEWGRNLRSVQGREVEAADELERAIDKRKWVYRNGLYAKHVASNPYTRFRPFPTPAQFSANADLIARATTFIRRELRIWGYLDVEFLTTFTISLMKSIDIRSESAIKLLAEFLDLDTGSAQSARNDPSRSSPRANAEHFAHELYCYLRSPYRNLSSYDSVVQYDIPDDLAPPQRRERTRRWASPPSHRRPRSGSSPSHSRSRSRQRLLHPSNSSTSYVTPCVGSQQRSCSPEHPAGTRKSTASSPTHHDALGSASEDSQVDLCRRDGAHCRNGSQYSEGCPPPHDRKGKGRATAEETEQVFLELRDRDVAAATSSQPAATIGPPLCGRAETGPPNQDTPCSSPTDTRVPRSAPTCHRCDDESHNTPLPTPETSRRQRARHDAWASIKAHLPDSRKNNSIKTPGSANQQELSVKGAARGISQQTSEVLRRLLEDVGPPASSQSGNPSPLLQRLSGSSNSVSPVSPSAQTSGGDVTASPLLSQDHTGVVVSSSDAMSAREIMARTRARLTRITGKDALSSCSLDSSFSPNTTHAAIETFSNENVLSTSARTIDGESPASAVRKFTAARTPSSISLSNDQPTGSGLSDIHNIHEQRRQESQPKGNGENWGLQHQRPAVVLASPPSLGASTEAPTQAPPPVKEPPGSPSDPSQQLEEDLRRQLRLQTRLAAERRKATAPAYLASDELN